ncbi:hypothetical protein RUM43_010048 [Polyplax serrata]|uniref:Uncharacterized protein n=1 Tax=Polyplax serrata TaxID=468196 RepID=A0AAN8S7U3_POLSC
MFISKNKKREEKGKNRSDVSRARRHGGRSLQTIRCGRVCRIEEFLERKRVEDEDEEEFGNKSYDEN